MFSQDERGPRGTSLGMTSITSFMSPVPISCFSPRLIPVGLHPSLEFMGQGSHERIASGEILEERGEKQMS